MSGVVVGNGLGLFNSSLSLLGQSFGSSSLGQAGLGAYINARTGNLVLSQQDTTLAGLGLDANLLRTYNSQGQFSDDNGDNWNFGISQLKSITPSSSITRVTSSGSEVEYQYDNVSHTYKSTEGSGAHDYIKASGGGYKWYLDGETGLVETYSASGLLQSQQDRDGNLTTYTYTGSGLISTINTPGQTLRFSYSGDKVTQVRSEHRASAGAAVQYSTVARYQYDSASRLSKTIIDLSPENNSIADGKTYETSYTYDGSSKRVASVTQSDGTSVSFTYQVHAGQHKVRTVSYGNGEQMTYTYGGSNSNGAYTRVTNALGQDSLYFHNAQGQLTRLESPAVSGQRQVTKYAYDGSGNVISTTDAENQITVYQYDARGNRILERDALGNTVKRTYSSKNQLLTETVYLIADPDGAGSGQPSAPITSRYVYDSEGHLRFSLNGEGEVQEQRFHANGQLLKSIVYTGNSYSLSGLSVGQAPSLSQMTAWVGSADKSQSQLTQYTYDYRGQITSSTVFSTVDANGNGVSSTGARTSYIHDYMGSLLETITPKGNATSTANDYRTRLTYDGLGRVLSTIDAQGNTSTTQYFDSAHKVVTHSANGLYTTTVYDAAGRVMSVSQSSSATDDDNLGKSYLYYDDAGRLRATKGADGSVSYVFYDASGRVSANVDGSGSVVEYQYNKRGQVTKTIGYANEANTSGWLNSSTGAVAHSTIAAIRPATHADDRMSTNVYDNAGRLSQTIDGENTVTTFTYDGAGRVIKSQTGSRLVRSFYDDAGRQIGSLDARGAFVENVYDEGGRLVKSLAYSNFTPGNLRANGTFTQVRPSLNASLDRATRFYYDDRGQLIAQHNAEGYVTKMTYDKDGQLTQQRDYYLKKTGVTDTTTYPSVLPATNSKDRVSSNQYNQLGQLISSTNYEGTVTTYKYDAVGNLITSESAGRRSYQAYDEKGQLTHSVNGLGSAQLGSNAAEASIKNKASTHGTRFVYDTSGRVVKSLNANGDATIYYYDVDGNAAITVDAEGGVSQTLYNAFGDVEASIVYAGKISTSGLNGGLMDGTISSRINAVKDANQDTRTEFKYNHRGQLQQTLQQILNGAGQLDWYKTTNTFDGYGQRTSTREDSNLTGESRYTQYSYDATGNLSQTRAGAGTSLQQNTNYNYDAFGRVVKVTDARGYATTNYYDRLGRQVRLNEAQGGVLWTTYDAFDRVVTQKDPLNRVTTYGYNDAAKQMTVTSPDGAIVRTTHNAHGETVTVRDANGHEVNFNYDQNGNIEEQEDALGATQDFAYDQAGRLLWSTDKQGTQTSYTYDKVGRVLTQTIDPTGLALTTSYQYDGKGQILSVTDPRGTVTETHYDKRGQIKEVIKDPGGLHIRTRFSYDGLGNQVRVTNAAGTASEQVTEYGYDALGRRVTTTQDPDGLSLTTSYEYDKNDNVVRSIDAKGIITAFEYDKNNRLTKTTQDVNGLAISTSTVYDLKGQVIKRFDAKGVETRYEYATDGQLTKQINDFGGLNQTMRYEYDANNNRIRMIDAKGVKTRYYYDDLNRVYRTLQDEGGLNISIYSYYDANSNLVRSKDANGNLTHYVYDNANRLTFSVDANNYVTQNVYDDGSNLIERRQYHEAVATQNSWSEAQLKAAVNGTAISNLNENFTNLSSNAFNFSSVGSGSQNTITHANGALVFANKNAATEQRYSVKRTSGHALADNVTTRFEITGSNLRSSTDFKAVLTNADGSFFHGIEIFKESQLIEDGGPTDGGGPGDGGPIELPTDGNGNPILIPAEQVPVQSIEESGVLQRSAAAAPSLLGARIISSEGENLLSLGLIFQQDKTYVVEIESSAEGTTLSFYEKGNASTFVFSDTNEASGTVGDIHFEASTRVGPILIPLAPGRVSLDNYSESVKPRQYTEQHYAYDALGRNTYSANGEGYVTKNTYDASSRLIKTERFDKSINHSSLATEHDFEVALKTSWYQDFTVGAGGFSNNLGSHPNLVYMENGKIAFDREHHASSTWPGIYRNQLKTYEPGLGFRAEVSLKDLGGEYLSVAIDNDKSYSDTNYRRHRAHFGNGGLSAIQRANASTQSQVLGSSKADTNYIVEFETHDGYTMMYLFEKGLNRKDGYSHKFDATGWGNIRIRAFTHGGPNITGEPVYLDNIHEYNVNAPLLSSTETEYVYDAIGRLVFSKDAVGNLTENKYDANSNLIEKIQHKDFDANDLSIKDSVAKNYNTAENLAAWQVYDPDPVGGKIETVFDDEKNAYVTQLTGAGTANGYRLWNESINAKFSQGKISNLRWDMKYGESFTVYISVQTTSGHRYLTYRQGTASPSLSSTQYINHYLGNGITNGDWQSIERDLEADLKAVEADNELLSVNALLVRGTGKIGQVTLEDKAENTLERYQALLAANTLNADQNEKVSNHYVYDNLNRLAYTVDAAGYVKQNIYDANSRLTSTRAYDRRINGDGVETIRDVDIALRAFSARTFEQGIQGSGFNSSINSHPNSLKDEDGRVEFVRALRATGDTTANASVSVYQNYKTYENGTGYRAEVTTEELTNQYFWITINNSGAAEEHKRLGLYFRNGVVKAYERENNVAPYTTLGNLKANTTYVVEFEMYEGRTVTYMYEKGSTREQGFSHEMTSAPWNNVRFWAYTYTGPTHEAPNSSVFLDNVSEYQVNTNLPSYKHQHYVYDDLGRQTYMIDPEGYVTQNIFDANGNITETRKYDKKINGDAAVTEADVSRELRTQFFQDFNENLAGLGNNTGTHPNLVYHQDGQVVFDKGEHASSTWPGIYRAFKTFTSGLGFRAEISTKDIDTEYLTVALDNSQSYASTEYRRHGIHFANGKIYAYQRSNAVSATPLLGNTKEDATYVVEMETTSSGSKVYIYEKGEERSSGYSHTLTAGGWGNVRIRAYTYGGVGAQGSALYLDNLSEYKTSGALPAYQKTRYAYDKLNRVTSTTDALNKTESYTYDANGNRTSMTNKKGHRWDYSYDKNNQMTQELSPQVTSYYRQGTSTTTTASTARLKKTFSYDYMGKVTSMVDADGTDFSRKTRYEYDKVGNQTTTHHPKVGYSQTNTETGFNALGLAVVNKDVGGKYSYKTYTDNQQVEFEVDALGYVTHHEYDAYGNEVKVTRYVNAINITDRGDTVFESSEVQGLITSNSNDRVLSMYYDANNRQTSVVQSSENSYYKAATTNGSGYTASPTTRFTYDAFGNVTKQSVKLDSTRWADTYFYYDDSNRRIATVNSERYLATTEYDAFGNMTQTTAYARQLSSSINFNSSTPPAAPAQGNAIVGYDRVTTYQYDALNRQTVMRRSVNQNTNITFATTTYDAVGNVLTSTDVNGQTSTNILDALGRTTKVTASARAVGNSFTNAFANVNTTPTVTYKLDVHGNVLEEVQASGQSQSVAANRVARNYYDEQGRLTKATDPLNQSISYSYDVFGRVTQTSQQVSESFGGWSAGNYNFNKKVRYSYDAVGQQISTTTDATVNGINRQITQKAYFNGFGEQTKSSIKDNSSQEYTLATYVYDKNGNLTSSTERGLDKTFHYNLNGKVTKQTVEGSQSTINQYDKLGRLTRQQLPTFNGSLTSSTLKRPVVEQSYDAFGNAIEVKERRAHENGTYYFAITKLQYNFDNKVTRKEAPNVAYTGTNGQTANFNPVTTYTYNNAGQVTKITDAKGYSQFKYYDSVGNLVRERDALNANTYHAYNAFGEKIATKNALGIVTTDHYDKLGQVTKSGIIRSGSETTLRLYGYDQLGNRTSVRRYFSNYSSAIEYTRYDQNSQVVKTRNGASLEVHYKYDRLGNKTFESDGNTRNSSTGFKHKTWVYSQTTGRLLEHNDLKGRKTTYTYNNLGQLTQDKVKFNNQELERRDYTYYQNGLTKSIVQDAPNSQVSSYYNDPDVIDYYVNYQESSRFEYDVAGNRTQEKHNTTRQTSVTVEDYSYDDYGGYSGGTYTITENFVSNREVNFVFDSHNRLIKVTSPQQNLIKDSSTKKTTGLDHLIYKYDENGNRRYVQSKYRKRNSTSVRYETHYYDYDKMNRLTVSKGVLTGGGIGILVGKGTRLTYDALGQRRTAETYEDSNALYGYRTINHNGQNQSRKVQGNKYKQELYYYNDQGQMREIRDRINWRNLRYEVIHYTGGGGGGGPQPIVGPSPILDDVGPVPQLIPIDDDGGGGGSYSTWHHYDDERLGGYRLQDQKTYDNQGRLTRNIDYVNNVRKSHTDTTYYGDDRIRTQRQYNRTGSTDRLKVYSNYSHNGSYDAAGNLKYYTTTIYKDNSSQVHYTNSYTKSYEGYGSYREALASASSTLANYHTRTVRSKYDARGNLMQVRGYGGDGYFNREFVYTREGQILFRVEGINGQDYYHFKGNQIGSAGEILDADFDYNFQAVSASYPAATPNSYTVNNGDTLRGIAQSVYGDSSLWYMIADANSVQSDNEIREGMRLVIPNVVSNVHNDSETFRPFDPNATIGDTNPAPQFVAPPPPRKKGCGIIATILIVIVAVVVTIYTAGAGAALFGAVGTGTAAVGATTAAAGAAVLGGATIGGSVLATVGVAVVAGAVGAAAGQLAGMALGVRDKFSWKEVALGGLSAGIGAGAGAAVQGIGALSKLAESTKWLERAAATSTQAVVSQAANYGANQLVGNKSKFNWASLAATAIAAPLSASLSNSATKGLDKLGAGAFVKNFGSKFVSGSANSIAQQVIAKNGKYDVLQTAVDAFGNAVADFVAHDLLVSKDQKMLLSHMEKLSNLTDEEKAIYEENYGRKYKALTESGVLSDADAQRLASQGAIFSMKGNAKERSYVTDKFINGLGIDEATAREYRSALSEGRIFRNTDRLDRKVNRINNAIERSFSQSDSDVSAPEILLIEKQANASLTSKEWKGLSQEEYEKAIAANTEWTSSGPLDEVVVTSLNDNTVQRAYKSIESPAESIGEFYVDAASILSNRWVSGGLELLDIAAGPAKYGVAKLVEQTPQYNDAMNYAGEKLNVAVAATADYMDSTPKTTGNALVGIGGTAFLAVSVTSFKKVLKSVSKHLDDAIAKAKNTLSSKRKGSKNGPDGPNKIKTKRFTNLDDFNRAANNAKPNTRYEFGSNSWTTDELGRVSKVEGKIDLTKNGRKATDGVTSTKIGKGPDAIDGDVGFHILGDQFNGPVNKLNVVPGNGKRINGVKNLNQSSYKIWENQIKGFAGNHNVNIKIQPGYNKGNLTTRPDFFNASYQLDNGKWVNTLFENRPGG